MTRTDQIRLQVPARPEYGRVARIAAAQLALRLGFSLHEIDDVRLVMDELALLLVGDEPTGDTLTIDFEATADMISVDAHIESDADSAVPDDRVARFREHVGELIDSYTIDPGSHHVTLAKLRPA